MASEANEADLGRQGHARAETAHAARERGRGARRVSGGAIAATSIASALVGCVRILGIGDVPEPYDGGGANDVNAPDVGEGNAARDVANESGAETSVTGNPGDASDTSDTGDGGAECPAAETRCADACVDTRADPSHCGACAVSCGATRCYDGTCGDVVTRVAAGEGLGCVVRADGTAWCFGANQYGELGAAPDVGGGPCGPGAPCAAVPQRIPLANVVDVSAGLEYACAVTSDGQVSCWGKNDRGQLGHDPAGDPPCADATDAGTSTKCSSTPKEVAFPAGVAIARVTAGWDSACALTRAPDGGAGGDVYCWGDNRQDEAAVAQDAGSGAPPVLQVLAPTKVAALPSDVIDVQAALEARFACALRVDRTVWCWGATYGGRLGIPDGTGTECDTARGKVCTPVPVQVRVQAPSPGGDAGDVGLGAPLAGVTEVRTGSGTACGVVSDGTVWCWGSDGFAVLGDPADDYDPSTQHPGARRVPILSGARSLALRYTTALATDDAGTVLGWGQSTWGAIGNGSVGGSVGCPRYSDGGACVVPPVPVAALASAKAIGAGVGFGLAIAADGGVLAWGRNDRAQLGHAPMTAGDRVCGQWVADPSFPYGEQAPCNAAPTSVPLP